MAAARDEEPEDEDYFLAPQDQRAFGAGIKRKRIAFVPASSTSESTITQAVTGPKTSKGGGIGARYLSIVLPKQAQDENEKQGEAAPTEEEIKTETQREVCQICNQPLSSSRARHGDDDRDGDAADIDKGRPAPHESSLAHQVCLTHTRPPSHLDRSHVGVRYLSSYGWDVDSGTGLGVQQDGIRIPIKLREKNDTVGLREHVDDDEDDAQRGARKKKEKKKGEPVKTRLNAKQVRLQEAESRKRAERLRQALYGPDLEKYLGPNG